MKEEGTTNEDSEFEMQDRFVSSNALKYETQTNRYFSVKDIVESFLESIYKSNNYDGGDLNVNAMSEEDLEAAIQDQKNEDSKLLQNVIATQCREQFNVSDYSYYNGYSLIIDDMYVEELSSSFNLYVVYGTIVNSKENVKLMVVLDHNNLTYEIYPQKYLQENELENLKEGDTVDIEPYTIEKNLNNVFSFKNIDTETIVREYFNDYKVKLSSDVEALYNSLDEEYKNKRFGSLEVFERFINENKDELTQSNASEYLVNNLENYKEYVCKDQYGNMYIFRETSIMQYSLLFDTYTIPTDKFMEQYNNSSNENKVKLNIDKWVKMLNNRDYENAFNCLDETFRVNTFNNSEAEFEQYMREKYPGHYEALYGEVTERNGIYGQSIVLKDITGEDTTEYHLDIVMQLGEDLEFVMSFTVE